MEEKLGKKGLWRDYFMHDEELFLSLFIVLCFLGDFLMNNLFVFFFHREWTVPTLKLAREKQKNTFNILENEYYNCC
jgi:hypothetical protein